MLPSVTFEYVAGVISTRDLWYIVARAGEYGYVVGISRDASVTVFNQADRNKYLEYATKEIYSLII